jgi:hypothetical protein
VSAASLRDAGKLKFAAIFERMRVRKKRFEGSALWCIGMRTLLRLWWNWQTRYFEVVVEQSVQVQVLLTAPSFFFPNFQ